MGLLDDLAKQAFEPGTQTAGVGQTTQLAQAMLGLLEQHGGVQGLMQLFQEKGLGELLSSWIGTGENLPINAQQLLQVLGHAKVGELAQQAGLSADQGAAALAQLLPSLIDKLTPDGQVPAGNQLLELGLGLLRSQFGPRAEGR